jgi:hypothetical protein
MEMEEVLIKDIILKDHLSSRVKLLNENILSRADFLLYNTNTLLYIEKRL